MKEFSKIFYCTNKVCSTLAIFNPFHLMAYKLITKILQHSKKYIFFANRTKIGMILIDLQNSKNNSNYLPFLLQNDFLKIQVPILVYKDFWYQELTDQIQPYCETDVANKMQPPCMTYILMVQETTFTPDAIVTFIGYCLF